MPEEKKGKESLEHLDEAIESYGKLRDNAYSVSKNFHKLGEYAQDTIEYLQLQRVRVVSLVDKPSPIYEEYARNIAATGSAASIQCAESMQSLDRPYSATFDLVCSGITSSYVAAQSLTPAIASVGRTQVIVLGGGTPVTPDKIEYRGARLSLSEFKTKIVEIDPELGVSLDGVVEAIEGQKSDWRRHALSSFREILEQILRKLAPDEVVKKAEWYVRNPDAVRGVTRHQRIKFIAESANAEAGIPPLIQNLADNLLGLLGDMLAGVHATSRQTEDEITSMLESAAWMISKVVWN